MILGICFFCAEAGTIKNMKAKKKRPLQVCLLRYFITRENSFLLQMTVKDNLTFTIRNKTDAVYIKVNNYCEVWQD